MLGLSPDVMSELWFGFMFFMFAGFVLWENERNTFPTYKKKKKKKIIVFIYLGFFFFHSGIHQKWLKFEAENN